MDEEVPQTVVRRSYNDLEKGFIFRKSKVLSGRECYNFLLGKMRDMELLIPAFDAVLNTEIPASWGAPGEVGDAVEIKHAVGDALRSQRRSAVTVSFKLSVIRSFFEHLRAAGAVTLNPAASSPM